MRKQYLHWSLMVLGIVGTIYGTYLLIYHYNHGNGLNVLALVLLILGILSLLSFLVAIISIHLTHKKRANEVETTKLEEAVPVEEEKPAPAEALKEEPIKDDKEEVSYTPREKRTCSSSSIYSYSTVYVKKVGYGPLLRIEGSRIIDMRTNTYYRIENNFVMQDGYGVCYEIRGNQIKDAFGGYLYEISGSNINKVFGGFYASISGNYITIYDLSDKYEMTDSLSKRQILVVAALLFGKY